MCLRPRGQVADARTPLLKFKMNARFYYSKVRVWVRNIPKLLAYNQGKILLLFFGVFREVNLRLTVSNSIFGLDRLTRLAQAGCRTRRWQYLWDLRKIRAVNPPRLQTLRIDGERVIDDVIMQGTWRHFLGKNARKRWCFNCNIWPNCFNSHQSHYCLYYNGLPEFVRKRSLLIEKWLKQRKIFEISSSESRIYKKWQTSAIIREIWDSNLETGRNGLKSGVSRIIRESWQPCKIYSVLVHANHRQVNSHLI